MAYDTYSLAHRIGKGLWVGAAPRTWEDREWVMENFDVVVFCAEEYQPRSSSFPGVRVIRCGIDDDDLTRREKEKVLVTALDVDDSRRDGEEVLVTCWQGVNRSALVAASALILAGKSPAGAIEMVRRRRRVPHVLSNPSFVRFLRDFWAYYDSSPHADS